MRELIVQLLHQEPFRTIHVIMRSGERIEIVDRLGVAMGWKRMIVLLPGKTAELSYEKIELVYQPYKARH